MRACSRISAALSDLQMVSRIVSTVKAAAVAAMIHADDAWKSLAAVAQLPFAVKQSSTHAMVQLLRLCGAAPYLSAELSAASKHGAMCCIQHHCCQAAARRLCAPAHTHTHVPRRTQSHAQSKPQASTLLPHICCCMICQGLMFNEMRSKTKCMMQPIESLNPADFPDWSYDGSSTGQAKGNNSDCIIK